MSRIALRTMSATGAYAPVRTSPATTTRPVVSSVSTATRRLALSASSAIRWSRTESLIRSAILSGCPSVTDSEVNSRPATVLSILLWNGRMKRTCRPASGTRVSAGESPGDLVPDDVGERGLGPARDLDGASVGGQDDRLVVGAAEDRSPADVVDDEEVAALAGQLGAPEVEHRAGGVAGLGGEAHDDGVLAGPVVGYLGEDVGVLRQLDGRRGPVVRLLDLGLADRRGPEVGGRRGHHDRVGGGGRADDRLAQLLGRLDAYDVDAGRVGQGHVGADEGDVGPPRGSGPGEGVALEAGGPVAEEPDRVEVLAGAAGGDDHLATGEVLGGVGAAVEQPAHQLVDLVGIRQAALAGVGAGEAADSGLDDDRPPVAEGGDVGLRGRVLPHLGVHGRGEDHRAAC